MTKQQRRPSSFRASASVSVEKTTRPETGGLSPAEAGTTGQLSWKRCLLRDLGQAGLTATPSPRATSCRRNHGGRGCSGSPATCCPRRRSARRNQPALGPDACRCARAAQRRPAPKEPARLELPGSTSSNRPSDRLQAPARHQLVRTGGSSRPLVPPGLLRLVLGVTAQWKNPSQKLNACSSAHRPLTMGKPKSRAMGTGPSIGTTNRRPKPADTR
jgi:hypothetical protein